MVKYEETLGAIEETQERESKHNKKTFWLVK